MATCEVDTHNASKCFFGLTSFPSSDSGQLVLVEGGGDLVGNAVQGYLADSEIFDPKKEMWVETSRLPKGRRGHTSTLLPNAGKVLIAGGVDETSVLTSAELYDSGTKRWLSTHDMNQPRNVHTAVPLGNDRVLVVGGWNGDGPALKACEIYDYTNGIWTLIADMSIERQLPGCIVLPAGTVSAGRVLSQGGVLVIGGFNDTPHTGLAQTELYDLEAQNWIPTAPMNVGRWGFGALWLPSIEKVLVADGITSGTQPSDASYTPSAELYDIEKDQWARITDMTNKRGALDGYNNAIYLKKDGTVLMVGGDAGGTSEVFVPNLRDPTASSWKPYDKSRDYIGQSIGRSVWLESTGQVLFVTSDYSYIYTPY
jgi:hypothetical protein